MLRTGISLLIVEDEPLIRKLMSQIFLALGMRARTAEDGFQALELIREEMPDIVLSDLNMPGMSGFELLSVIRRRLPAIYVIATSGAYQGKDVPFGVAADAFHEKATNFPVLLELMDAARLTVTQSRGARTGATPVWVQRGVGAVEDKAMMLCCPECLRVFSKAVGPESRVIEYTECIYCTTVIEYAMVEPLDPLTSQPYLVTEDVGDTTT